jgi:hypothetical protein
MAPRPFYLKSAAVVGSLAFTSICWIQMTHGHRATAYPIHGAQINIWRQSTFFMGNLSVFRAGLKVKIRFFEIDFAKFR